MAKWLEQASPSRPSERNCQRPGRRCRIAVHGRCLSDGDGQHATLNCRLDSGYCIHRLNPPNTAANQSNVLGRLKGSRMRLDVNLSARRERAGMPRTAFAATAKGNGPLNSGTRSCPSGQQLAARHPRVGLRLLFLDCRSRRGIWRRRDVGARFFVLARIHMQIKKRNQPGSDQEKSADCAEPANRQSCAKPRS